MWIARHPANAERMVAALKDFGFDDPEVTPELFLDPDRLVRIGVPPLQLEILTSVSGLTIEQCATRAEHTEVDGVPARFISLRDLRINKRAAGRTKDLADLEELPDARGDPDRPETGGEHPRDDEHTLRRTIGVPSDGTARFPGWSPGSGAVSVVATRTPAPSRRTRHRGRSRGCVRRGRAGVGA